MAKALLGIEIGDYSIKLAVTKDGRVEKKNKKEERTQYTFSPIYKRYCNYLPFPHFIKVFSHDLCSLLLFTIQGM